MSVACMESGVETARSLALRPAFQKILWSPPSVMASLGPPPGLESLGPPPGLEGQEVLDDAVVEPHDAPWHISVPLMKGMEDKKMIFMDGLPATVKIAPLRICRHCDADHAAQTYQTVEERLKCEVAEAVRLLALVAPALPESQQTSNARSSNQPPADSIQEQHSMAEPFARMSQPSAPSENAEATCTAWLLQKHCAEISQLCETLTSAVTAEAWDSIADAAAHTFALVDAMGDSGDGSGRAVQEARHTIQNVMVLAASLGLTDDEFRQLGAQGMPTSLKARLSILLHMALGQLSVDACLSLLSRLGVAKYHVFNRGVKFSRRRRREKKPNSAGEPNAEPLAR